MSTAAPRRRPLKGTFSLLASVSVSHTVVSAAKTDNGKYVKVCEPFFQFSSRLQQSTKRFFKCSVLPETSCLRYLLQDKRDVSVTGRLHQARTTETLKSRTVKF